MQPLKLVILGAGGFAEDVADIARDIENVEIQAFVEGNDKSRCGSHPSGVPIIWIDEVSQLSSDVRGICAVGTTRRDSFVESAAARGLEFTSLVHPSAVVAQSARVGAGSIVGAGVVVGACTSIGRHTIVNRGCLVGHHVKVGDFVTLGPGSNIGGHTRVGDQSFIGLGAAILDRIVLGAQCAIGAGALVTKDVRANVLVLGAPARVSRELPEGM